MSKLKAKVSKWDRLKIEICFFFDFLCMYMYMHVSEVLFFDVQKKRYTMIKCLCDVPVNAQVNRILNVDGVPLALFSLSLSLCTCQCLCLGFCLCFPLVQRRALHTIPVTS